MRDIVRLFIPPVFLKIRNHFRISDKRVVVETLPKRKRIKERMVIIGNGPSLIQSVEKYSEELELSECMAVNCFALSDLYDLIRPSVYVLMDPVFFSTSSVLEHSVTHFMDVIVEKTQWPLTMVMPVGAKNSIIVNRVLENQFITLEFVGGDYTVPKGYTKNEAWDLNLLVPPTQTVLNTCVYLAVYWGYPQTYLIGADTSFLADLRVDQQTNCLYTIDSHFYNKDIYKDNLFDDQNRRPINTRLDEELFSIATALHSYWDMKEYAEWKGVKVFNSSEYSWIDAFERKKLK